MNRIKTHADTQRLPLTDIKPGSLVVVRGGHKALAATAGQAAGGHWATVIRSEHVGQGLISMTVQYADAPHPTGRAQFIIRATGRALTRRAL